MTNLHMTTCQLENSQKKKKEIKSTQFMVVNNFHTHQTTSQHQLNQTLTEHYSFSHINMNILITGNKIIPPINFCPVEHQLYRSGQPSPLNFPFLSTLNLKCIVWLSNEDPEDSFLEYCDLNNITIQFSAINPDFGEDDNPWDGLNEKSIANALNTLLDKRNYPLLVCCGMGRHRTGTVIGCLRRIMNWNLASCSEEYRRFTGSRGGRILVELLIEGFNKDSIQYDEELLPDFIKNSIKKQ